MRANTYKIKKFIPRNCPKLSRVLKSVHCGFVHVLCSAATGPVVLGAFSGSEWGPRQDLAACRREPSPLYTGKLVAWPSRKPGRSWLPRALKDSGRQERGWARQLRLCPSSGLTSVKQKRLRAGETAQLCLRHTLNFTIPRTTASYTPSALNGVTPVLPIIL